MLKSLRRITVVAATALMLMVGAGASGAFADVQSAGTVTSCP
ncbi:hypothetical protein ACWC2T_27900 [Streptomyces sp. NPDC001393]